MNAQREMWHSLVTGQNSKGALNTAMWRAVGSMSTMAGRAISNDIPQVETVPISQVVTHAGDPEAATVGIYLVMEGSLGCIAV